MIKRLLYFPIAFAMIFAVESISKFSFYLADLILPSLQFLDRANAFLYITIHHIFQGLIALLIMYVISLILKITLADFGLTDNQWKYSLKRVIQFALVWWIIQLSVGFYMMSSGTVADLFSFELTVKNYLGYFLFQILLSGTSEELLYRALLIGLLLFLGNQAGFSKKLNIALAVMISLIAFIIGHVSYTIFPFAIVSYNVLQLLTVVIFGGFYTFLFIKTKSVVGPMLAHNLLNGIIVLSSLILTFVFS